MKPDFDNFKKQVLKIAKREKKTYLVPNSDFLYIVWEKNQNPEEVVKLYCTPEAQKKRHSLE